MNPIYEYNKAIFAVSDEDRVNNTETARRSDLAALIQLGLGHPLDAETFESIAAIQKQLQQEVLVKGMHDPAINGYFKQMEAVLGNQTYSLIFGDRY